MFASKYVCRILLLLAVSVAPNVFSSFVETRTASATYEKLWTTSGSEIINRTSRSLTNATCPDHMFQCESEGCIFQNRTCDNIFDCDDRSDENETMCKERCLGSHSVENGEVIVADSTVVENKYIYRTYRFKCSANYTYFPRNKVFQCSDNKSNVVFPQCLRTCPSRLTELVETSCEKDGTKLDCSEPLVEGTTVSMKCKPRYDEDNPLNRPAIECDTVCGQVAPQGKLLIINGTQAKIGEFPWHVGIYRKTDANSKYDYICGGSIINPKVVLAAAHCFTEENGTLFDVKEFSLAAGKYFRNYESNLDFFVQKREVELVNIPSDYKGFLSSYSADIALVIVIKLFQLSNAVRPICIDWNNVFESEQLRPSSFGKVAGWGYTLEGKSLAPTLRQLTLPYINRDRCVKIVPEHFIRFVTPDKFCAGYQNGSSVCNGDSGGGLVFYREEDKKYYIRGLVSIGPVNSGACDSHQYGAFTKISHYIDFIREIMEKHAGKCKRLDNKTDNETTLAVCSNGTWDTPLITCVPECGQTVPQDTLLILGGSPVKKNNFPWHVGIYSRDPLSRAFQFYYVCGGSIISANVVLTLLDCFYEDVVGPNDMIYEYYVAAGKYYRYYNSPHDILAQRRKIVHFEYNKEELNKNIWKKNKLSWELALVITDEPFTVNNFIRPVCIDWDNSLGNDGTSFGTLTDWDLVFNKGERITQELKQVTVPFFNHDICNKTLNITGNFWVDSLCTIYSNETTICHVSQGIGLVSYNKENKKYYLRGIVAPPKAEDLCNNDKYIRYVSVAKYLNYIKSVELKYRL